ncbi:MAG: hypothetical protein JO307_30265, partial [Bryobacterales bacterium]|nr:hypothetical protein [Bryobacterales bacterium]
MLKQSLIPFALAGMIAAQTPAQTTAPKTPVAAKPAAPSRVDEVIQLVKGGMSEPRVIRTLQNENKPINLTTADLLKLQKAGVSENIINVMENPSAGAAPPVAASASAPSSKAPAAVAETGSACPLPAAVSSAPGSKKRRLAVEAFDYSAVQTQVTAMFNNNVNIGQGIRAMLTERMGESKSVVLLEREKLKVIMAEQDFGATNRVKQGKQAKIGQITGADAWLLGDIVIFGRDDTRKKNGAAGAIRSVPLVGPLGGKIADA